MTKRSKLEISYVFFIIPEFYIKCDFLLPTFASCIDFGLKPIFENNPATQKIFLASEMAQSDPKQKVF